MEEVGLVAVKMPDAKMQDAGQLEFRLDLLRTTDGEHVVIY